MSTSITVIKFPQLTTASKYVHATLDRLRRLRPLAATVRKRLAHKTLSKALVSRGYGYEVAHRLVVAVRSLSMRMGDSGVQRLSKLQRLMCLDAKVVNSRVRGATQWISRTLLRLMRDMRSLQRTRSLSPMTFVRLKAKRKAFLAMFRAAAMFAVVAARIRHHVSKRNQALRAMAIHFVETMVARMLPVLATRVATEMDARMLKHHVAIIERAWCNCRLRRRGQTGRKQDLIDTLLVANAEILELKMRQRKSRALILKAVIESSCAIHTDVERRLSARLIQRVWRGSRARRYVDQLISKRKREACQKVQRERIRAARQFLWTRSSSERKTMRAQQARVIARTMMQKPNDCRGYWSVRRESLEKPLISEGKRAALSTVGIRPISISVFEFEKVSSRSIRINPSRVYVKIPVSYSCIAGGLGSTPSSHLTYESVPASLLMRVDTRSTHH